MLKGQDGLDGLCSTGCILHNKLYLDAACPDNLEPNVIKHNLLRHAPQIEAFHDNIVCRRREVLT